MFRIYIAPHVLLALLLTGTACTYKDEHESSPSDYGSRKNKNQEITQGTQAYGVPFPGTADHHNQTL